jgi:hypothetical protein
MSKLLDNISNTEMNRDNNIKLYCFFKNHIIYLLIILTLFYIYLLIVIVKLLIFVFNISTKRIETS